MLNVEQFKQDVKNAPKPAIKPVAEKAPEVIEQQQAADTPPTPQATPQNPPTNGNPNEVSPDLIESMQKYFKSQGIDMTLDQVTEKLKGGKETKPAEPLEHTVDDTEVEQYFEKMNQKDQYKSGKDLIGLSDIDLMIAMKKPGIKAAYPDMTDEQIDSWIKRSYFQDQEGFYEEPEQKYAQTVLSSDAAAIRDNINGLFDGAKQSIKNGKALSSSAKQHEANATKEVEAINSLEFSFGKSGNTDLGTFSFPVLPESKNRVKEAISSPERFAKYVSDENGNFDMKKVAHMVMGYETKEALTKSLAQEFHSRGASKVEALLGDGVHLQGDSRVKNDKAAEVQQRNVSKIAAVIGRS